MLLVKARINPPPEIIDLVLLVRSLAKHFDFPFTVFFSHLVCFWSYSFFNWVYFQKRLSSLYKVRRYKKENANLKSITLSDEGLCIGIKCHTM